MRKKGKAPSGTLPETKLIGYGWLLFFSLYEYRAIIAVVVVPLVKG